MNDPFTKNKIPDSMIVRLKKSQPPIVPVSAAASEPKKPSVPVLRPRRRASWSFAMSWKKVSPVARAIMCAAILGVLGGAGVFVYLHGLPFAKAVPQKTTTITAPAAPKSAATTATSSPSAVDEIVRRVSKLMSLPAGEEPAVAMVSDIATLKGQPFFRNAKNGDFVLMYAKAKRAIIYDAVHNKIVEVAPIVDTPPTP